MAQPTASPSLRPIILPPSDHGASGASFDDRALSSATAGVAGTLSNTDKVIAESDRIPNPQKAAYALGTGASIYGIQTLTDRLWMPFFNIGLGLSPVLLGILLMYFRLVEALVSPLIGIWSDNTRSRFGRRRPWIFAGAILMGMAFPAFFMPTTAWTEREIIVYMLFLGTIMFAAYSLWSVPYLSLGMELTPDYDERTRLGAWASMAGKVLSLFAGWILLFVSSSWFADPASGRPDVVNGIQGYSLLIAPILVLLAIAPALMVKERYYEKEVVAQKKEKLWISFKESVTCKPLWSLTAASAFLVIGNISFKSLGVYVNIYYVYAGDIAAATALEGVKYTVSFVVGLLSLPILTKLSERFDKKSVTMWLVTIGLVGQLSNIFLMRPDMPYLQIIPAILSAGLASSVWMFVPAMKADVVDYDEVTTMRRREGSLHATYSLFFKLALLVAAGLGGFVLQATGFDVSSSAQPADVLWTMLVAYSVLPPLVWVACIISFLFYRLDRAQLARIRLELEHRRGVI